MAYSIRGDHQHWPTLSGARPSTILRHCAYRNVPSFLPLRVQDPQPSAPLTIVVHPGDLLEDGVGYATQMEQDAVRAFGVHTAQGLDKTLAQARADNADIVVLHRESSVAFVDSGRRYGIAPSLWKRHLCPLMSTATALWAEDLEAAAAWLLDHASLATRPSIHLAGAYACPQFGCITFIGKALLTIHPGLPLTVSPFSPPANGPGLVWRPTGDVPMDIPPRIQALYDAIT